MNQAETIEINSVVQSGSSVFPIATSPKTETRLALLGANGIQRRNFQPDTVDFYKAHHGSFKPFNSVAGYTRVISDTRYITTQVNLIQKYQLLNRGKRMRYLTTLPEGINNYDSLRNAFLIIEDQAGLPDRFIFVEKGEQAQTAITYCATLGDTSNDVIVIDDRMMHTETRRLVAWALVHVKEIVILYSNISQNQRNYSYLFNLPQAARSMIHIARIPLGINTFDQPPLIAGIFIGTGFKSVSFTEPEIQPYLFKRLAHKPRKNKSAKLRDSIWVDQMLSDYHPQHPAGCSCLSQQQITQMDVDACVLYHAMENLSKVYQTLIAHQAIRKSHLKQPILQPIITQLGIVI